MQPLIEGLLVAETGSLFERWPVLLGSGPATRTRLVKNGTLEGAVHVRGHGDLRDELLPPWSWWQCLHVLDRDAALLSVVRPHSVGLDDCRPLAGQVLISIGRDAARLLLFTGLPCVHGLQLDFQLLFTEELDFQFLP